MFHVHRLLDASYPEPAATHLARRRELPQRLLARSRASNRMLACLDDRLDALEQRLDPTDLPRALWHDPELHAPLVALGTHAATEAAARAHLRRLGLLLGDLPLDAPDLSDGIHRVVLPEVAVWRRLAGALSVLPATAVAVNGARVYQPIPGLFDDLPFPEVYRLAEAPADPMAALHALDQALRLLERVDAALYQDLGEVVQVIALLPPLPSSTWTGTHPPQSHWSFNLRLRYPGALFVNPFTVGASGLVEGLVHEYVHQRLWLAWELDPPDGLPPWEMQMVSPVSGVQRPVRTMIHAAVVYRTVIQTHTALLDEGALSQPQAQWCRARRDHLRAHLPELFEQLRQRLEPGMGARQLVEAVAAS